MLLFCHNRVHHYEYYRKLEDGSLNILLTWDDGDCADDHDDVFVPSGASWGLLVCWKAEFPRLHLEERNP
jgi:hypothetical protein